VNVKSLKKEVQIEMLKDICKQLSETSDDWLDGNAEGLLDAIVGVLDEQSQDDAWGTEGWQHFFGYED
jgi:hypothetical protein